MSDILNMLDRIERDHSVEFDTNVRTAVEARAWLVRLGVPFTLDGLLRAVLRNGFAQGSIFGALKLSLSQPRRDRRTLGNLGSPSRPQAGVSNEVVECLDLAARIRRGLCFDNERPEVTQDSVVIAAAQRFPEVAARNLVPRDLAERSLTAVRVVAERALSERVGASRHYLLRKESQVHDYFRQRTWLCNWRLKRFIVTPSSIDRHLFIHISVREEARSVDRPPLPPEWQVPGRHVDLYFYGVADVLEPPRSEEFNPGVKIAEAVHAKPETGEKQFTLELAPEAATRAGIGPRIELSYLKELTAGEHLVSRPSDRQEAAPDASLSFVATP